MSDPLDEETVACLWATSGRAARLRYHAEEFLGAPAYDHAPAEADPRAHVASCANSRCPHRVLVNPRGGRRYCSHACMAQDWYHRHAERARVEKRDAARRRRAAAVAA